MFELHKLRKVEISWAMIYDIFDINDEIFSSPKRMKYHVELKFKIARWVSSQTDLVFFVLNVERFEASHVNLKVEIQEIWN